MNNLSINNLEDFLTLSSDELKQLFSQGKTPDTALLHGMAKGLVVKPNWFKKMNLWRGKVFNQSASGAVSGFNRIGLGSLEILRYNFTAEIGKSRFSDQNLLIINHNLPKNPKWVRQFHDEMVEVKPGIYLATSHYKKRNKLELVSYFVLDFNRV